MVEQASDSKAAAAAEREGRIIVGIDLGTTNSLVAYCDEKGPRIICGPEGEAILPSVVRLSDRAAREGGAGDQVTGEGDGGVVIGRLAREHAVEFAESTVFSIKRLMGQGVEALAGELKYLPYEVVEGANHTARVKVGGRIYSPQEISAMILRKLKGWAEAHFGREVKHAVITVPAYFDDAQRQATRDAGMLAGLEVLRVVNEPTAAALAYDLDRTKQSTIAVYDLGGGTFDVSILKLDNGVFHVLSTSGDTHLGGDDIDRAIVELIQKEIRGRFGEHLEFGPGTRQAMRNLAEAVKIRLSIEATAKIQIDLGGGRTYERTLERGELEAMALGLVERTLEACGRAVRDAKLELKEIQQVVMVGGSTRMPLVRRKVGEFFGLEPYTALDPDKVVALGASVQASILAGINRQALLLDVVPLSLGIETLGGAVAKLIMRNSTVPASAKENFSTYIDGQTNVKIHVLQGERELADDCRSLGVFELRGIPPMPAGLPKIQVTFFVDANGILTVSAVEQRSEKRAKIQIVPHHGLGREEIGRMVEESFQHARADMTAHQLIDLRNQAKLDMRQILKQIEKVGAELDEEYRGQIERKMAAVQVFLDAATPDAGQFHKALDEMDKATVRLAELAISKTLREV